MLYILLCGYPPFYGQTDPQILEAVKKGKYDFSGAEWKNVSESARDLIKKMLVPHETRLDSEAVLKHPWMQAANKGDAQLNVSFDKLKNFIKNSKFKQASLQYLASQMDERDIDSLIKEFNKLDADGDGEIGISEFKDAIVKLNRKSTEEIENVFKQIDSDCNGRINYTEFIAATMNQSIYLKEEKLYQAFKMFDKNNDGFISADEIKGVLGSRFY
jgi:calcium-dependent protein kinase